MSHAQLPLDPRFAAIVLAGGAGRRLGGVDKAALVVRGATLLERALRAVADASPVVVVGPHRDLPGIVLQTREQPAGGGPVAAVAAGLVALAGAPPGSCSPSETAGQPVPDVVLVLACDMPFLDAAAVARVVAAVPADGDGAAYVDSDGRRQHLAAAYRTAALARALAAIGPVEGAAMRDLAKRLTMVEIEADPETTQDFDTWDALASWPEVQPSTDAREEA